MTVEAAAAARKARAAERRIRWIVRLGGPLIRLLASTWRYDVRNGEAWRMLRLSGRPFIYALWHGHLLPLTWFHRGLGVTVMISEHADGEIIARLVESWGYRTVRGSTSRGAGRALLGMVREIQAGQIFAITPDGPRGPAGAVQPGVLLASSKAGAPILPLRVDADRSWRLRSWDRFVVPKPFARVRVTYGEPWTAPGVGDDAAAALAARIGAALDSTPVPSVATGPSAAAGGRR